MDRFGSRLRDRSQLRGIRISERQFNRPPPRWQAGSSGRGYCWAIGKTRRFLRLVGRSGCIIRPSSTASSARWPKARWLRSTIALAPAGKPTITLEAKAWLVSLACRKAKDLGYPHELWTTRLLAHHARAHGPAEGHAWPIWGRAPCARSPCHDGGTPLGSSPRLQLLCRQQEFGGSFGARQPSKNTMESRHACGDDRADFAVKRGELRRVKVGKRVFLCATDLVAFLTRRQTAHHVSFQSIAVEKARTEQSGPVANAE